MITGLDISLYQEYPWKKIDWKELKSDPLNFRFIWIKCQEGSYGPYDPGAYDLELVKAQVAGAQSVNFEAINLYHYYWYQYMNNSGVWTVVDAMEQALAFYETYKAVGLEIAHPMTDCEDPLIKQFLIWSDTASINKAIAYGRKLNKHLKDYHQNITDLFGARPDIYSGKWWLDYFVPLLIQNGYAHELEWMKLYKWILADYDGTFTLPSYLDRSQVIAWQKTSSPKPPVKGIPTGRVVPGDALDIDEWMLSEQEFLEWSKQGVPMTVLHNINTTQDKRAKVLTLEPNQKLAIPVNQLGIDAVILPMASMHNYDGSHWKVQTEGTFAGRFDLFTGIPVLGRFDLDAGSMLKEQHVASEFEGRNIRDNFILPFLLNAWHIGNWSWDTVLGKQGKWRDIKAIILSMTEDEGYPASTKTPDDWQRRVFEYVYFHLDYLMVNGMLPKVPVIVYSGGWWLVNYQTYFGQTLQNQKNKLYLHMGQWVNFSTATFNTVKELYNFPPKEDFKFETKDNTGKVIYTIPDGYFERILMHEFTGQAQKTKQITDASGNPTTVNLSLWNDTKEAMMKFLGTQVVVEVPPVNNTELEKKVADLEITVKTLTELVSVLSTKVSTLERWKNTPLV